MDKVNILLVDDRPAKLLSYEVILQEIGENLVKASSGREALDHLLQKEFAVVLIDVCMPELDGFQLANMIREHPRFQATAIIFVSAIHFNDADRLRGYEIGAADYITVPIIPELLRAKVRVFVELYRKTRQLEQLNHELEALIEERKWGFQTCLEQREELRKQALLAREADRRARNAHAVAHSIVCLTQASSIDGDVAAVKGRIGAMARAHALLYDSRWQGDFNKLLEEAIAPYWTAEPDRIVVAGPPVVLEPSTAQSLAFALYELATNASKYGPLSVSAGSVRLTWEVRSGNLVLDWLEIGGPPVEQPLAEGYDGRIIQASIERQLGGAVAFDWRHDGMHCTLSVPLGDKLKLAECTNHDLPTPLRERAVAIPQILFGKRLLLVEDEALDAMALRDMLIELGFEVLAYNRVIEALAVATNEDINAAVLDVNLAGELIYPVADCLIAKGIPFVFITGYGAEVIDGRFSGYPVLQKPVQRQMLQNVFVVGSRVTNELTQQSEPGPRDLDDESRGASEQVAGSEFTTRETEVLASLAKGKSNKMIARELDIREATVKVHIRNLLKKLNVTNRTQLALRANHALDKARAVKGGRLMIPADPAADQCSIDICSRSQKADSTPADNQNGNGTLGKATP